MEGRGSSISKDQQKQKQLHKPTMANVFESKRVRMARRRAERAEELELEKLVLGDTQEVLDNLDKWQAPKEGNKVEPVSTHKPKTKRKKRGPVQRATKPSSVADDDDHDPVPAKTKRKPVWEDDDDLDTNPTTDIVVPKRNERGKLLYESKDITHMDYKAELEKRFVEMTGVPTWAKLKDKVDADKDAVEDATEGLLKRVGNFIRKGDGLVRDTLDIKFCSNLAWSGGGRKGAIRALEFHPSAQVALMARSKSVILRQVDGIRNSKIQEVNLNFPVTCARFTRDGERFVASSTQRPYCYIYDMMAGKTEHIKSYKHDASAYNMETFHLSPDNQLIVAPGICGNIHFLMTKTHEHLFTFKMNSDVRGVAFNADSSRMYSNSVDGEVYVWDMRQRKCLHKFNDDGCIHGTSIALASSEQFLATGSDTGVVNVYDMPGTLSSSAPAPQKTFLNLTTAITELKFNSTSEILAMASSEKKSAIRLVHCASMTVFSNFPNSQSKLDRITALDMSANSGFLTVGADNGVANLLRLNYYGNY